MGTIGRVKGVHCKKASSVLYTADIDVTTAQVQGQLQLTSHTHLTPPNNYMIVAM